MRRCHLDRASTGGPPSAPVVAPTAHASHRHRRHVSLDAPHRVEEPTPSVARSLVSRGCRRQYVVVRRSPCDGFASATGGASEVPDEAQPRARGPTEFSVREFGPIAFVDTEGAVARRGPSGRVYMACTRGILTYPWLHAEASPPDRYRCVVAAYSSSGGTRRWRGQVPILL